jgi:hypothetical protein
MMGRIALKWGIGLGIAICIWTWIVHILGWYTTDLAKGLRADEVAIILPLFFLYMAISEYSRRTDRAPKLLQALGVGVLTGLFSVPISSWFLWIYHHHINPQWLDILIAYQRQHLAQTGATPEVIEQTVARLTRGGTDQAQLIGALIGTILISIVISILVWALMRFVTMRGPRTEEQ